MENWLKRFVHTLAAVTGARSRRLDQPTGQRNKPTVSERTKTARRPEPGQGAGVWQQHEPWRIADAWGTARGLQRELAVELGGAKLPLVLIPAGQFMMGDNKGQDCEKPVHRVIITQPFYLGKYEVTQDQWKTVMGKNPSAFEGPNNPVENVTWLHCQEFLARLNDKFGLEIAEFSLPTEAQWEYACRAGRSGRYGFRADVAQAGDYAWWAANSHDMTHPVGQKKPNAWGLFDMHGNVWEWCADWFAPDYYGTSPIEDPAGPTWGVTRVVRGGAWCCVAPSDVFRIGYRCGLPPEINYGGRGLRVAANLKT